MKRMLYRMLALAMCLCLGAGCAFGEATPLPPEMMMTLTPTPGPSPLPIEQPATAGGVIVPQDESRWVAIQDVVPVGDEVYMLSTNGLLAEMWHWNAGMAQAELVDDGLLYAVNLNSVEDAERKAASTEEAFGADVDHAIGAIFTDGESLYGYNNLTSLVFQIDVTAEGLKYTDVATLPAIDAGRYYLPPIGIYGAGDWVLCWVTDHNSRNYSECLLAFSLKTGGVKQAVLPAIDAVSSYKDGKVLVLCRSNEEQSGAGNYAVYCYDPQNDLSECLGVLPVKGVILNNFTYSPALDMVIYQNQTRIMGWNAETGAEQLAFIPTVMRASITAAGENLLYAADTPEIKLLHLQKGYATGRSLTLLGGTMHNVLSRFFMRYQDVPVYYSDLKAGETTLEAFTRAEDMPDMAYISGTGSQYQELLEGGYLMDLSAYPDLMAYADKLYPVWRELVEKDGGVYGLPVNASSYTGWFINKKVMTDMGLTEADIPTSLTGICEFATRWNNEYAEKYPHYTLLNNTTSYRIRLLDAILTAWMDYCLANDKPLTMDDPILREALAALDAAQLDKLDASLRQTNPEVSEYKQALIWTGCKIVGNWASYMEEYSDRIFIPLTLTDDTPYTAAVTSVSLWVINARSENAEYAASLLAESLAKQDVKAAYVMRSDMTEPVLSEYYSEKLAYELERLERLEEAYEESVNKAAAERRIKEQKEYIEVELKRDMYDVTPSAIENYRNVIAPVAFVRDRDVLTGGYAWSGEAATSIDDYVAGKISAEEFIAQMELLIK